MSAIQSSSLYQLLQTHRVEDALSLVNELKKEDTKEIYKKINGKNCFHLILNEKPSKTTEDLLDKIIDLTVTSDKISKFQKSKLFLYALASKQSEHLNYLFKNREKHLKNKEILQDEEISECFHWIVEKSLIDECETFLKKLKEKDLQWISKLTTGKQTTPFIQSVQKDQIRIFEIFLSYLLKIERKEDQETIIFKPQANGETILHAIARNSYGSIFFSKLINAKLPLESSQQEVQQTLLPEVISHLDDQDKQNKTPLYIACENKKQEIAREFLNYGADFTIPSLERKSPWSVNSTTPYDYMTPEDVASKNLSIKRILDQAIYGSINPEKHLPKGLLQIMKKRKEPSLIQCCKNGRLENAKALIKGQGIDASIVDANDEDKSLSMIILNRNNSVESIIDFIDFLVKESKINFKKINKKGDNLLTFVLNTKDYNPFLYYPHHADIALYLIEKYHKKFLLDHSNNRGETALTLAAQLIDKRPFKSLLKFSSELDLNANQQGKKGMNSLLESLEEYEKQVTRQVNFIEKLNKEKKESILDSPKQTLSKLKTNAKEFYDEYSANVKKEQEKRKFQKK